MRYPAIFIILLACIIGSPAGAQSSVDTSSRRNTIKLDITSYWLYRNAVVLSFERVTKKYESWAVSGGFQQFPSMRNLDSVNVTRDTKASGFKLSGEYRFYMKKENKYNAPRGVYMGPYLSLHNFHNERDLEVMSNGVPEAAELTANINIINIGFQLGYQFVINDRWTFDLAFTGPALSNYRASLKLNGNFSFDEADVNNEVIQALIDRFPWFDELISGEEVDASGKVNTWAWGYRYQFQVGYRFGRKK